MAEALLPPEVLQTVDDVDHALQQVEEQMSVVLPNCTRESLEELTAIERATTFLALSKALNALFCLYLRTNGLSPDGHPAKSELDRVTLYKDKVQKAVDRSTGPRRPTSSLNVQAANRFIEHAIPDLSQEQKRLVREIGKKGGPKRQHDRETMNLSPKKRPSGLSIADEAAAFLAETSKEIMLQRNGELDGEDRLAGHLLCQLQLEEREGRN